MSKYTVCVPEKAANSFLGKSLIKYVESAPDSYVLKLHNFYGVLSDATNKPKIVGFEKLLNFLVISTNKGGRQLDDISAMVEQQSLISSFFTLFNNKETESQLKALLLMNKHIAKNNNSVFSNASFDQLFASFLNDYPKLLNSIGSDKNYAALINYIGVFCPAAQATAAPANKKNPKDGGKFIPLQNADEIIKSGQQIVLRFPPEASGYLHVGHAKAALLNAYYRDAYKGKLILRFDDTNPLKENAHFEEIIQQDLVSLGIKFDHFSRTSNFFEQIIALGETLIKQGDAYCDDTPAEQVKELRAKKEPSPSRNRSVEENLTLWRKMLNCHVEKDGEKYFLRAKIDYKSDNGCMRDPTLFRCRPNQPHLITGDKFKVYPTYDFACPIVDSLENVTHCLRTSEYADRDAQYRWIIEKLKLRLPEIASYSRLNFQYAVLSKRKLAYLVDNNFATGWDDPRFPTVRGLLRRGMTISALKSFVVDQGFSKNVNNMGQDKIWSVNKSILEKSCARFLALDSNTVLCEVVGESNFEKDVDFYNAKSEIDGSFCGFAEANKSRKLKFSKKILIEENDIKQMKAGDKVTLMNWGNAIVKNTDKKNFVLELNLNDTNYRNTLKVTWLGCEEGCLSVKAYYYECLFNSPTLSDNLNESLNKNSEKVVNFIGETSFKHLKVNDMIQIVRKGFFRVDSVDENSIKVIAVPDGSRMDGGNVAPINFVQDKNNEKVEQVKSEPKQQTQNNTDCESRIKEINDLGGVIRELKANKADKAEIDLNVKKLLKLKEDFNNDFPNDDTFRPKKVEKKTPAAPKSNTTKEAKSTKTNTTKEAKSTQTNTSKESKTTKETKLSLQLKKAADFPDWYAEVIVKGNLIDYYDISGCYILKPSAFAMWKNVERYLNENFVRVHGVRNCYFPMFVTKNALYTEKSHIADFSPEVAWVSHKQQDNNDGKESTAATSLDIAIRPTSETVIYPSFAKWVKSYRDLPLKINQWCNVVRWEFKNPTPFIRSREFLWQEGHTAFATKDEAVTEVFGILEIYKQAYKQILAVPVIKGVKTKKEQFPGADFTTTVESFIPESGRGVQGGTSHFLGQNFSKMFDIQFEDENRQKGVAYQNSWGFTTRSLGIGVMLHSDDQGLVVPPAAAENQIVIVPCGVTVNTTEQEKLALMSYCSGVEKTLGCGFDRNVYCIVGEENAKFLEFAFEKEELRVIFDNRENVSPGWKFNDWELKGVPMRIEIGMEDMKKNQVTVVMRNNLKDKKRVANDGKLGEAVRSYLRKMQEELYETQEKRMKECIYFMEENGDFKEVNRNLDDKKMVSMPFCGEEDCEERIKKDTVGTISEIGKVGEGASNFLMGAKSLCIPMEGELGYRKVGGNVKCGHSACKNAAKHYVLFGRSY